MLREVVDRECLGGISCASARAAGVSFQACLIDRSSISPFRINDLRTVWNSVAQTLLQVVMFLDSVYIQRFTDSSDGRHPENCVRPCNLARWLKAIRAFSAELKSLMHG